MSSKGYKRLRVLAAGCFLFVFVHLSFGQDTALSADLRRSFKEVAIARFENLRLLRESAARNSLIIPTTEKSYELIIRPHDLRSPGYRAEETGSKGTVPLDRNPAVNTFKGTVAGEPAAPARLTITDQKIEGYFITRSGKFYIEPASKFSALATPADFVVYQEDDLFSGENAICPLHVILEREKTAIEEQFAPSARLLREIELATDADFQFVSAHGGVNEANVEILSIMNMVEGVYELELGLTFAIVYQHAWSTPDPYDGVSVEEVLRKFQAYWNTTFPPSRVPRDAAHLWSAKSGVLAQGLAFVGAICSSPNFAYGVSGHIDYFPIKYSLTAHEIGHNLNASHVGESQGCGNTIMFHQLTQLTEFTFCPLSRQEITSFVNSSGRCLSQKLVKAVPFDFDGDGRTDLSVFRPSTGEWWYAGSSNERAFVTRFGTATDVLTPADFTGDGRYDIAVWRPGTGFWFVLRSENNTFFSFPFGQSGDIPAPADYDGDGRADAAVFRPSGGLWYILNSINATTTIRQFGIAGDVPVTADYDGDARSDLAVYRRSTGEWWIERSLTAQVSAVKFGLSTDRPAPGDYTGDGRADIAFWRPSNGHWFILRSENFSFFSFPFGITGDIPVPGDYDGDEKLDAAVFRPSTSTWFINRTSTGTLIRSFGRSGDIPVPSAYVR